MHNGYFASSPYTDDDLVEPISLFFSFFFFLSRKGIGRGDA